MNRKDKLRKAVFIGYALEISKIWIARYLNWLTGQIRPGSFFWVFLLQIQAPVTIDLHSRQVSTHFCTGNYFKHDAHCAL